MNDNNYISTEKWSKKNANRFPINSYLNVSGKVKVNSALSLFCSFFFFLLRLIIGDRMWNDGTFTRRRNDTFTYRRISCAQEITNEQLMINSRTCDRGDGASSYTYQTILTSSLCVLDRMASAVAVNIYGVNKLLIWSHKTNVGRRFVHSVHWCLVTVSCVQILSLLGNWKSIAHNAPERDISGTRTKMFYIFYFIAELWYVSDPDSFDFIYIRNATKEFKETTEKDGKKEATDHFVDSACYFVLTKTYLYCLLCSFLRSETSSNATVTLRRSCLEFRYLFSLHCRWLLNWYQFRWDDNVSEMKRRKYRKKKMIPKTVKVVGHCVKRIFWFWLNEIYGLRKCGGFSHSTARSCAHTELWAQWILKWFVLIKKCGRFLYDFAVKSVCRIVACSHITLDLSRCTHTHTHMLLSNHKPTGWWLHTFLEMRRRHK